jgi:hypothetical protein
MSKSNTVKLKSNGRIGYVLPSVVQEGGKQPCPTDYRRVVFPSNEPNWKATTQKAVIQIVHISKLAEVTDQI